MAVIMDTSCEKEAFFQDIAWYRERPPRAVSGCPGREKDTAFELLPEGACPVREDGWPRYRPQRGSPLRGGL